jgi:hypothetical protein
MVRAANITCEFGTEVVSILLNKIPGGSSLLSTVWITTVAHNSDSFETTKEICINFAF